MKNSRRAHLVAKFEIMPDQYFTCEVACNIFGRLVTGRIFKGTVPTQSGCCLPANMVVFDHANDDFKLAGTSYFDYAYKY